MIIVKKRAEVLKFGLFLVLVGGLVLYVISRTIAWESVDLDVQPQATGVGQKRGAQATGNGQVSVGSTQAVASLAPQVDLSGESYFADHRMQRDQLRAGLQEQLATVMADEKTDADTAKLARQRFLALGEQAVREARAEDLIRGQGFADAVVSVTDQSCEVVVQADSLSQAQFVRVVDLVSRVTGIRSDRVTVWSRSR
jgi:stage III sporulation protein AH